jgi:hypothetical protein
MGAVKWLVEKIENNVHHTIRIPREYFEQALEIEREHKQNLLNFIEETRDLCNKLQFPTEQELLELKRKANIILRTDNVQEQ